LSDEIESLTKRIGEKKKERLSQILPLSRNLFAEFIIRVIMIGEGKGQSQRLQTLPTVLAPFYVVNDSPLDCVYKEAISLQSVLTANTCFSCYELV